MARAATLLADASPAQRVLARAVMNGETTDPEGWRTTFPTLFSDDVADAGRRPIRGDPRGVARGRRPRRGDPQPAPRRDRRGGHRAAAGTARRAGTVRRERRILFDGVRAEIHPYDVTVEREGAAEAYDCKWGARGINADVLNQLDDARTHAADEDGPDGGPGRLRCRPVVRVRLDRQTAPPEGIGADRGSRRSTNWRPVDDGRPTLLRRVPGPLRRGRTGRPVRTSTLLRYAQDLASFHSAELGFDRAWYAERGLAWLARAAAVAVLAPIAQDRR